MKAATLLSLLSVTGLVAAAPAGNGPAGGIIDRDLPVPGLPTKDIPIVGGLTGGNKGGEKPGSKVTAREDPTGSTPDGKGNGAGGDLTGLPGQGGLDSPADLPTPELPPVKLPGGLDSGKGGLGLGRRASPVDGLPVVGPVVGGVLGGGGSDSGSGAGAQGGAGSGTVGRRASPVDGLPVVGPVVGGVLGGGGSGSGSGAGAQGGAGSGTVGRRGSPVDGLPVVGDVAKGATGGLLGGDAGPADGATDVTGGGAAADAAAGGQ
ncbi:hypothetical protein RU639_011064 [Aspergillus parasiticus]